MSAVTNQRDIFNRRLVRADIDALYKNNKYSSNKRQDLLHLLRKNLAAGSTEIVTRFNNSGVGIDVLSANSFMMDQLIRIIFDTATSYVYPVANRTTSEKISVIAVGGYGRSELAPYSDIDLMFLHPYKKTPYSEQVVEFILYMLWDLGLKVGHSTRSIDDCIRLSKNDPIIQTSLLDARWLWGDQLSFNEFRTQYRREVVVGNGAKFVEAKLYERDQRHNRVGDSRYVLEPNIKEGKGGLRDLQTLYWLTKFLYGISDVSELTKLKVFIPQDIARFQKAMSFLSTVRCHLHYLASRAEERITFDVQKIIGERMNYRNRSPVSGVERFMKDYFLVAKDVGDLTRVLCAVLEEQQKKKSFFRLPQLIRQTLNTPGLIIDSGRISVDNENTFNSNPLLLLKIFAEAQNKNIDIHPEALRLISKSLHLLDEGFCKSREANMVFVGLMTSTNDPETSLRRLNEAGVFGRFIPDFGRIVAQMEFSMYHSYTVDEHTIRAIGILSRIESGVYSEDMPNVTKAMKEIHSRTALYVALFLHDIAKGRNRDHSELGAELALTLCPRLGLNNEETETVSWLVREHLTMSDIAFKRDYDDPKTIKDFVAVVKSVERLKLLTILTCADIRAVGPKTWNSWKSRLLRGLYIRTLEHISGDMVEENRAERINHAKEHLKEILADWLPEDLEKHISIGHPHYWLSYDGDTHIRHAKLIQKAKTQNKNLHIETRIDEEFEYSEITIYAPDHPGLFSEIAGVMALFSVNIVNAKIVTLSDGMVLDTFSFLDANDQAVTDPEKLTKIILQIEDALSGKVELASNITKARENKRTKEQETFVVASRVIINNQASSTDTIIEVNGSDRIGLLYDITAAMTKLGLRISSSHITTFGEEVVDTFYVKDVFGLKITHKEKINKIRDTLLTAVAD